MCNLIEYCVGKNVLKKLLNIFVVYRNNMNIFIEVMVKKGRVIKFKYVVNYRVINKINLRKIIIRDVSKFSNFFDLNNYG